MILLLLQHHLSPYAFSMWLLAAAVSSSCSSFSYWFIYFMLYWTVSNQIDMFRRVLVWSRFLKSLMCVDSWGLNFTDTCIITINIITRCSTTICSHLLSELEVFFIFLVLKMQFGSSSLIGCAFTSTLSLSELTNVSGPLSIDQNFASVERIGLSLKLLLRLVHLSSDVF